MELFSWLLLLPLTIATLIYGITAAAKISNRRRLSLPPGPAPLPVVGNLFSITDEFHRALAGLAKVYGSVMTIKLGFSTTIVVSSPEAAREVLQTRDQQLSGRSVPDVVNALGHADLSVVFQPTNQLWKQLRGVCTYNLLSNRCLDSSRPIRQEKLRQMVARFRAQAGRPVDFGRVTFETVLNVMSNAVFSVDMADLNFKSTQEFRNMVSTINEEIGKPNISDFFPTLGFLDLQGRRRAYGVYAKDLLMRIDEMIGRRLNSKAAAAGSGSTDDFLDHLLQLLHEAKLDRKTIKSLLGDLFVAGTDTTSITLVWAMAELQRNPAALAKVRSELQEVVGSSGSDEVEESDIAKLPYLQAVIKEVLRLHPPVPLLIPRRATEEVELGGYAVPKGSQLLVNVWAIGHNEQIWPEAEMFKPERFLGKEMDVKGRTFELIPFGSGRRACPGMLMALRTTQLALATLLHAFEWRLPDGMEPRRRGHDGEVWVNACHGCSSPCCGTASPLRQTIRWLNQWKK